MSEEMTGDSVTIDNPVQQTAPEQVAPTTPREANKW